MRREKGITLVALVITVIILIILAAVSIKAAMNGGLIVNAKTAKEKWDIAKTDEEEKLGSLLEEIEGKHVESENGQVKMENSSGAKLMNYKVYGNTVEEQSVGERTKNLVNIPDINGDIQLTTIECYIDSDFVVSCGEYPTSIKNPSGEDTSIWRLQFNRLDGTILGYMMDNGFNKIQNTFKVSEDNPVVSITYRGIYIREGKYSNIQIEYGDTPTEYEPYGKYKIPVTVSGENVEPITTNIYLDEPLRKIGDKADYIDFKNQKVVRYIKEENGTLSLIENGPTEEKISLPEIPTINGTTILTVNTTVTPSKIEVNYEAK